MTEDEADDYEAWAKKQSIADVRAAARSRSDERFLAQAVEPTAKKLGLKVHASYDPRGFCYCIDVGLTATPRKTYSFDEDLMSPDRVKYLPDLIARVLDELQCSVFDAAAKRMTELSARGRVYGRLDKDDKDTLFEMLRDATDRLYSRYVYAEGMQDAVDTQRRRYEALAGKLFR